VGSLHPSHGGRTDDETVDAKGIVELGHPTQRQTTLERVTTNL